MTCAILVALLGAFQFNDAFDYANGSEGGPAWYADSVAWHIRDGLMTFDGGTNSFCILEQAPHGSRMTVGAVVTMQEARSEDWLTGGIAIRRDDGNYWHLALVEGPAKEDRKHHIELAESLDGVWLGHTQPGATLTQVEGKGWEHPWEYGRPYRLRIELAPERIDGFVDEMDGTNVAHIAFVFDSRAVTTGQPALQVSNAAASLDDVAVNVVEEAPAPEVATAVTPYTGPGHAAIAAEATGYFHAAPIDGRWWVINPRGEAFYIIGTDHIRYEGHWCEALGYAPYGKNMREQFPDPSAWADLTIQRLQDWGFNTLAAGHSPVLRYRGLPHIEFLTLGASFSPIDDICPKTFWTGFPNVFSPDWPRHCDKVARRICAGMKDDPWLIGYFIDNELEWFGKDYKPWGLFDEAWKKPADHTAKQAWVAFLRQKLSDVKAMEALWGVQAASWEELAAHISPTPPRSPQAETVAWEWVREVARLYFQTTTEAIRRHDPNHMILGCRFAGDAPDVWDIAGQFCDIVSFNSYERIDVDHGVPETVVAKYMGWSVQANRPMMLTEWSYPALDTPLPSVHGAGMRVDTQAQRAQCFTHYQEMLFRLPWMVGSDYFMFLDEPAQGISKDFPEDSNYGLVNERNEPYAELTAAAKALNPQVYGLHAAGGVQTAKPLKIASWLQEAPNGEAPGSRDGHAGEFAIAGPTKGRFDLNLGGTMMGQWYPVMHNRTAAGDEWPAVTDAQVTAVRENERVTVLEFEAWYDGPTPYRSAWRLWMPREGDWFGAECLWVQNTGQQPFTLVGVYPYLQPNIGGDSAGDVPLPGATNYYVAGNAWVDPQANLGLGCWYADDRKYQAMYWVDEQGSFHADLRYAVDKALNPGERYEGPGPMAFFLPVRGADRTAFAAAANAVKAAVTE